MSKFVESGSTHGDFVVVLDDSENIKNELLQQGAKVLKLSYASIYYWGFKKLHEGCIAFSGIAKYRKQLITGPSVIQVCPDDVGQWIALLINNDGIEVRTDFLGMLPVFSSERLFSNRLHLMAIVLRAQGKLKFDRAALSTFFLQNQSFNYQLPVFKTPVSGVSAVPSGSKVFIGNKISIVEKLISTEIVSPGRYHELIDAAASEIRGNVEAALNSYHRAVCGLTGGKDSRLIYAALLNAGRAEEVVYLTTERDNDIEIATGLVNKFGGEYASYYPSEYLTRDREDALKKRGSIFYGLYHHLHSSSLTTIVPQYDPEVIRLTGGGGELYRPHFQDHGLKLDGEEIYSRDSLYKLLKSKRTESINTDAQFEEMFSLYVEAFERLPGVTINEKLDHHYLNFRNKFHFGVTPALMPNGLLEWHPIISRSLLEASRSLPPNERASGRVMFDVTKALHEELAHCRYGKPQKNFVSSPYHIKSALDGKVLDINPNPSLAKSLKKYGDPLKKPQVEKLNMQEFMWERIQGNIQKISKSEFSEFISKGVIENAEWMYRKRSKNLQRWFSLTDAMVSYSSL